MIVRSIFLIVICIVLPLTLLQQGIVESGCVKAKLCCQGNEVTCFVPGVRMNGKGAMPEEPEEEEKTMRPCFCDSRCIDIGDCCTDYRDQCKPVDCVLADKWQDWEPCDANCGLGTRQRIRKIVQQPLNGGKPCGKTVQRAVCEGNRCKLPRASGTVEEIREIGKILPLAYGGWRKSKVYNPYEDIRKNLFLQLETPIPYNRPSYCATYEVTEVRPGCQLLLQDHPWTQSLTKGASVCIECQSVAMQKKLGGRCNGHGVYQRDTRWTAVGVPGCHGTWIMRTIRKDCECNDDGTSFILV